MNPVEGSPSPPTGTLKRVIVISGASGAGKTTIAESLLRDPAYARARTATTRPPRTGEADGVDYDFLTEEQFAAGLARGEFLEHAEVYGRRYGTPRANLDAVLTAGRVCVLVVDVQGARTLREGGFDAYYVFVEAPSPDERRRRLEARGQDGAAEIARRIEAAERELEEAGRFDLVLVNDEVDAATARLAAEVGVAWTPRNGSED